MQRKISRLLVVGLAALVGVWLFGTGDGMVLRQGKAVPVRDQPGVLRVFMTFENNGDPDILISAKSPVAKKVDVLRPENGRDIVVPGRSVSGLSNDGAHIVLSGLDGTMQKGRSIPLTLTFAKAGELTTRVELAGNEEAKNKAGKGLFGIGDICFADKNVGKPEVKLTVNPLNQKGRFEVIVATKNFNLVRHETGEETAVMKPNEGHGHLYLNGLKLMRVYDRRVEIGPLPKGKYMLRVSLNNHKHQTFSSDGALVTATREIDVK